MNWLKTVILLFVFVLASAFGEQKGSFEDYQKSFERVKAAFERKEELLKMKCRSMDIPEETFGNIFLRVFKQEAIMELWVQKQDGKYVKFKEFKIYAVSGKLGPKREQGDAQAPEGFYYVSEFNPQSNYYLSLGINYPNESDLKLSSAAKKGSNIFIHGAAVSAGCLAMSNYYIEDIYICAVKARSNGQQKIPVQIFPFRPTTINMAYFAQYAEFKENEKFWKNLAEGYRFFEKTNRLPEVVVGNDGYYKFFDSAPARADK
jgi:murein L,D-transpeptidase YafK